MTLYVVDRVCEKRLGYFRGHSTNIFRGRDVVQFYDARWRMGAELCSRAVQVQRYSSCMAN